MKIDEVLTLLGEFGPYQRRLYVILVIPALSCGIQMIIAVFIQGTPDHRCVLPDWTNDTYVVQSLLHEMYIKSSIPYESKDGIYAECARYRESQWAHVQNDSRIPRNASTMNCNTWVYDRSIFETSIVLQFNLVCDRNWYSAVAQMILMGGVLVGSLVFGALSDTFGRKLTMYVSFILHLLSTFTVAWSPNFVTFVILRFLTGASFSGIYVTSVVMFGAVLFRIIPESPRWLLSKHREEEAEEIIRRVANYNKASLPDKLFDDNRNIKQGRILDIFRSPILLKRSAIICYNWFIVSMGYYGLSLNVGNMGGNIYWNFLFLTFVEVPAVLLCFPTLDRFGRRNLNSTVLLMAGLACVGATFSSVYGGVDYHWVTVTLSMLGKLGVSMGYAVIYLYTGELFPTCVRNAGMGMASMWASIGNMVTPYVLEAGVLIHEPLGPGVPMLVYGLGTLVAGFLALMLPETRNQRLPQTIEEGEGFGRTEEQLLEEKHILSAAFEIKKQGLLDRGLQK